MARYIDVDIALDKMKNWHTQERLMDCIRDQPTADVVKVWHGKWLESQEPLGWCDVDCIECSVCHESWIIDEDSSIDDYECMWHHCPHCGAKMEGKEVEGE